MAPWRILPRTRVASCSTYPNVLLVRNANQYFVFGDPLDFTTSRSQSRWWHVLKYFSAKDKINRSIREGETSYISLHALDSGMRDVRYFEVQGKDIIKPLGKKQ